MLSFITCILVLTASLLLFCISLSKVRNSQDKFEFIYKWGILYGAFVWEDSLVLSLALSALVVAVIIVHDIKLGMLSVLVFWSVRSAGETLYFFLQQFFEPKHQPHNISDHFLALKPLLGQIHHQKHLIIMQLVWQIILAGSLVAVILLILHWRAIPNWF